jgi:hypothetical protein
MSALCKEMNAKGIEVYVTGDTTDINYGAIAAVYKDDCAQISEHPERYILWPSNSDFGKTFASQYFKQIVTREYHVRLVSPS